MFQDLRPSSGTLAISLFKPIYLKLFQAGRLQDHISRSGTPLKNTSDSPTQTYLLEAFQAGRLQDHISRSVARRRNTSDYLTQTYLIEAFPGWASPGPYFKI